MIDYSKITEEEFDRRLNALPKDAHNLVSSMEFKGYIAEIASAYDDEVDEDVLDAFAQVILYRILGFINPNELGDEVLNLTLNNKELADEMAADINELVATLLAPDNDVAPNTDSLKTPYGTPKAPLNSSMETRVFIPPKSDFLKPDFYEKPIAKPAPHTQVKIDFGAEPKTKSVTSSPDIHPENVIDLKDLPR